MRRADNFLKVFLLTGFVFCVSFESQSQPLRKRCSAGFTGKRRAFHHPDSSKRPTLFDVSSESFSPSSSSKSLQTSVDKPVDSVDPTARSSIRRLSVVKIKKRVTKQQVWQNLLTAFMNRNFTDMVNLVKEFPFFKKEKIRFTDPSLLERIPMEHRRWCPKGWSFLQVAAYEKDLRLLDFLLDLDMNVRTISALGGVSVESNPLHISIRRDFKAGAERVLKHVGKVPFGEVKNRFIGEKDHMKLTPWFLAVVRDSKYRNIRYVPIVAQYSPSVHVRFYTKKEGDMDGYKIAYSTDNDTIKWYADNYLIAPNYSKYKDIKDTNLRSGLKPPVGF